MEKKWRQPLKYFTPSQQWHLLFGWLSTKRWIILNRWKSLVHVTKDPMLGTALFNLNVSLMMLLWNCVMLFPWAAQNSSQALSLVFIPGAGKSRLSWSDGGNQQTLFMFQARGYCLLENFRIWLCFGVSVWVLNREYYECGGLIMWVDGDESNRIFTSPVGGQLPSFNYFLTNTWAPLLLFSKSNCVTYRLISPTTRNSEGIESSSLTELCRCYVLFSLWILVLFHHFCSVSRHPTDRDWNLRSAPYCLMSNRYNYIVKLVITLWKKVTR